MTQLNSTLEAWGAVAAHADELDLGPAGTEAQLPALGILEGSLGADAGAGEQWHDLGQDPSLGQGQDHQAVLAAGALPDADDEPLAVIGDLGAEAPFLVARVLGILLSWHLRPRISPRPIQPTSY